MEYDLYWMTLIVLPQKICRSNWVSRGNKGR